jgi:hypothetical protein
MKSSLEREYIAASKDITRLSELEDWSVLTDKALKLTLSLF